MAATSLALAIVMGGIGGQNLSETLPFVMGGIMAFALSGFILSEAPEIYMSSANIIKNHSYPFMYYNFEAVTRIFIVFLHNIVVFYIAMIVLQRLSVPNWTLLPALVLVYINTLLWSSLAAMVSTRFRDLRFMLPFMSQIVFFLTPVFWRPEHMKGWRTLIIDVNPFYGLTEIIRAPLLGQAAPLGAWGLAAGSVCVGVVVWLVSFSLYRSKIAFWV